MQLANQASQLSFSATLSSKYGHFCLQKNKMAAAEMQTQGFRTADHKAKGDVTVLRLFGWFYGARRPAAAL